MNHLHLTNFSFVCECFYILIDQTNKLNMLVLRPVAPALLHNTWLHCAPNICYQLFIVCVRRCLVELLNLSAAVSRNNQVLSQLDGFCEVCIQRVLDPPDPFCAKVG